MMQFSPNQNKKVNVYLLTSDSFLLTFIKPIVVHVPVHVEVLSRHQGELCFRVLIRSIVRVITEGINVTCCYPLQTQQNDIHMHSFPNSLGDISSMYSVSLHL